MFLCITLLERDGEEELPIIKYKEAILDHMRRNMVTCIHGETGCGKSTKVPQFILDDYNR